MSEKEEGKSTAETSLYEQESISLLGDEWREKVEKLKDIGPAVSVLGTARSSDDSWEYASAHALARALSAQGIAVMTGGGPGVMEAANLGAQGEAGTSVGLNIELPHEQRANAYLDIDLDFRYFLTRKLLLLRYAVGFAVYPGGFGTIDELFELLTLVQTGKLIQRPIVLVGHAYWAPLLDWLTERTLVEGYIDAEDIHSVQIVENAEEAARILLRAVRDG